MGHGVKDLTLCAMLYALCVLLLSYVDEKNIFKNRAWNLFIGLELRLDYLGQG